MNLIQNGGTDVKIVFFAREIRRAGTTTHMFTLAKYLVKNGHKVTIFSYWDDNKVGDFIKKFREENIVLRYIPFPNDDDLESKGIPVKLVLLIKLLLSFIIGFFLLFKEKPDIIHVHFPVTSFIANVYRKIKGTPIVITHHIGNMRPMFLYAKADEVIAVSSEVAETAKKVFTYPATKVNIVFNGIEEDIFNVYTSECEKQALRTEQGLPKDDVILLYVGSIGYRKGLDILLKACSIVKEKLENKKFKTIILGSGDDEWFNELVVENKVEDIIIRRPFQNPIPYYRLSDIMVLPSRVEGFPLVCVEAMMSGLVIVRSNVEGAADQIQNGVDGFIFNNENAEELADIILNLIEDDLLRSKIAKCGQEKALKKFTAKKMFEDTVRVYEKAIKKC